MNLRNHAGIIFILCLGALLRLWALGTVPVSLSDDEVRLTASAYAIAETGKDVYGTPWPLSFPLDGFSQNPVPVYLTAASIKLFGMSMISLRLPAALMGISGILLLYLFGNYLFPKSRIGLFAAGVLSLNVWHIQISRFLHEGAFAFYFYLLALVLLFSPKFTRTRLTITAASLILGFYSYHATKLLLLPIVIIAMAWPWKHTGGLRRIALVIATLVAFTSLAVLSRVQGATKYGGKTFFFEDRAASATAVELERRASDAPQLIKTLYRNKYAYWARIGARNYLYTFSPQYLFLSQEGNGIYSVWFRGQLYLVEMPLLFIGWLYLFAKKRREWAFLTALAIISPLPSALGPESPSYTMRSVMLLIPLILFTGTGIQAATDRIVVPAKWKHAVIGTIFVFYCAHLIGYLSQYYYDWSRYGAKYYSYNTKLMVERTAYEIAQKRRVIVAPTSENTFLHWFVYEHRNVEDIRKALLSGTWTDNGLTMETSCLSNEESTPSAATLPSNTVYLAQPHCPFATSPNEVILNLDNEPAWSVYRSTQ